MRYDLGLMDSFSIEICGTCVENDPMFRITFTELVDPIRLENAIYKALRFHPLFGTQVEFDGQYYLSTNNRPIRIFHVSEQERPREFGKETNGYPWQVCWFGNRMTFEWCHGVTDGNGAINFVRQILKAYCGAPLEEVPRRMELGPGLEPFYDKNEKGIDYEVEPKGFSVRDFPVKNKRGYLTDCHIIKTDSEQLLSLAKSLGCSVSELIAIMYSKALRRHLPANLSNRKVACNIIFDIRRSCNYQTMHNCVELKRITYLDEYDGMELSQVCGIYKRIMDNARKPENVKRLVSERVKTLELFNVLKGRKFRKAALKLITRSMKDNDCNFTVSYMGKTDYPPEVLSKVSDYQLCLWHDFDECVLGCMEYKGVFTINICENFVEKGVVEDFIDIFGENGVSWEMVENKTFEQAHFEMEEPGELHRIQPEKLPVSPTENESSPSRVSHGKAVPGSAYIV